MKPGNLTKNSVNLDWGGKGYLCSQTYFLLFCIYVICISHIIRFVANPLKLCTDDNGHYL